MGKPVELIHKSTYREPFSNGSRVVQVQLAPRGLRSKRRVNGETSGCNSRKNPLRKARPPKTRGQFKVAVKQNESMGGFGNNKSKKRWRGYPRQRFLLG